MWESKNYWHGNVMAVTIFLAKRGVVYKDSEKIIGSKPNGNFRVILEHMPQFNSILMSRLDVFGNL